ncbi:SGNH hydrolase domain-containing protein [Nocardioides litoris]|uniref:SGNH hydrolase domain-containing protein n=1 Tax=Nocardioides litoris TaxID=1926648 RepID=UPI001122E82B|nr:SGNH hydrolase domain-containing protein [Nocardioides litoris]
MTPSPSPRHRRLRHGPAALVLALVLALLASQGTPAQAAEAPAPAADSACLLGLTVLCDVLPGAPARGSDGTRTAASEEPTEDPAPVPGDSTPAAPLPWYANPDFVDVPRPCRASDGLPVARKTPCRITRLKPRAATIVLWGDSHAWHMLPALRKAVGNKRVNLVMFFAGGCPPMLRKLTPANSRAGCDVYGHYVFDWLARQQAKGMKLRVVVGTSWELYHNITTPPNAADQKYPGLTDNEYVATNARKAVKGVPAAFRQLGRMRIPTDIIMPMPMVYQGAPACPEGPLRCDLPRAGVLKDIKANNARAWQMRRLLTRKGFMVRPAQGLCDTKVCHGTLGGLPVYYDGLHVGQRTSRTLARFFAPTVTAAVRQGRR